jgi:hypothetical protein
MKRIYTIMNTVALLSVFSSYAQTVETFETEVNGKAGFSDNGQEFVISTATPNQSFEIYGDMPTTGWNGTANDDKYIDNSGSANYETVEFDIATANMDSFRLKSMYLFLAQTDLSAGTGNCTITGSLNGNVVFTATSPNDFNSSTANNGFTFIDLATYGGSDNSGKIIDQFSISTAGNFEYVALDAMKWQKIPVIQVSSSFNPFVTCYGNESAAQGFEIFGSNLSNDISISVPVGFEVSDAIDGDFASTVTFSPTLGTISTAAYVRLKADASGTPSGIVSIESEGAYPKQIQVSGVVNLPSYPTNASLGGCDSVIYDNIVYKNDTIFSITKTNQAGCDSIIYVTVTINHFAPDLTIDVVGDVLVSNQPTAGMYYTWVDCATEEVIVQGVEKDSSFTAPYTGEFLVVIQEDSEFGCAKASDCVEITVTGVENISAETTLSIYPNPATDFIHVSNFSEVFDAQGLKVAEGIDKINISTLEKGLYLIKSERGNATFVKE